MINGFSDEVNFCVNVDICVVAVVSISAPVQVMTKIPGAGDNAQAAIFGPAERTLNPETVNRYARG